MRELAHFSRLTAAQALQQLRALGHKDEDLMAPGTMAKILKRLGYRLRRVLKAKPLKKIPQTDAIFGNVKEKPHRALLGNPRAALEWRQASGCRDHARPGWQHDLEGASSNRAA
jgi:hypothetical protein